MSGGFRFGIEAEYLLVDARTFEPLWHEDLGFERLNGAFERIPLDGIPSLEGLELEPPHRKLMPYVVEGYHICDSDSRMVDIRPKGVEIRTPVMSSIDGCIDVYKTLYHRLQIGMETLGYRAAALSHHPTKSRFRGPQNKRRHDFWLWAMEVMTTYGPDINVSLPREMSERLDLEELEAKLNYYGPALAAMSVASPFVDGDLWRVRGEVGRSMRTYRRSVVAPPIEIHPHEGWRLEFKVFEMSWRLEDFRNYFLLFLELLLDEELEGRASNASRIYDMGEVARHGFRNDPIRSRAGEILERAPEVLRKWGFEPGSLRQLQARFDGGLTPADELIGIFEREGGIAPVLRHVARLEC